MTNIKPQYTNSEPSPSSRRSFFTKLWVLLGIVALAELFGVLFGYFKPRKQAVVTAMAETIITAGSIDKFEPGTVTAFVRGKFYLARLQDGGFLALSRTCTHLGCTVPWVAAQNKFVCPCHSSEFDIRGEVISPPAPRALDIHPMVIENNIVKVNTGKRIKRTFLETAQVVYPKDI
ncbi:MAG: (2Fe-2S)-binding protein [Desulfobulbaceae bacterium]|jgi:cytochrome b6-f complex iron-sulfur subunit|nr:MAG: (2Fe-2S)-binding protein [Desulfobulbaceae bacterium]